MNIIIIEDETFAADHLERMILKYDKSINISAKLESVSEAVEWFNSHPEPDLIFLDIHLEDDLSFSIFEKVNIKAPIIFTTAFDEYAVKAFKLKSIDYLLKPILQEELNAAIEKFKTWKGNINPPVDLKSLMEFINEKNPDFKDRFSVTVGQKIKVFYISEIAYFYSEGGMSLMVTSEGREYPVEYSLETLTAWVDTKLFFRINRQFLVKLNSIKNVHIFPKGKLKIELNPPKNSDTFVSRDKTTAFKKWLGS